MGYSITDLVPGVSSHNNEVRVIETVPAPLNKMRFTQLVVKILCLFKLKCTRWKSFYSSFSKCGFNESIFAGAWF